MNKQITLWSFRSTPARGNHVVAERKINESEAQRWLEIFRKDEPAVQFVACKNKPNVK